MRLETHWDSRWQLSIRWVAIGCLILGIVLRFWHLDHGIFWFDEVATAIRSSGHLSEDLIKNEFTGKLVSPADLLTYLDAEGMSWRATWQALRTHPEHPPLYFLLTRLWMDWFGSSPASLRSLAAIFSLGLFPAIYWLCWELTRSAATGWVAIAIVSVSPFHVLYAREARQYSLWAVLVVLSVAALLRATRLSAQARSLKQWWHAWWPYSLALALGFYTALLTAYVALGHGVYAVLLDRGRPGRQVGSIVVAGCAAIVACIPWLRVLIPGWDAAKAATEWMLNERESRWQLLQRFADHIARAFVQLVPDRPPQLTGTSVLLAVMAVVVLGLVVWGSSLRVWGAVLTLSLIPIGCLAIPDLLDRTSRTLPPRYWTPTVLGLQVASALVAIQALQHRRQLYRWVALGMLVVLLTIGGVSSVRLSQAPSTWMTKMIGAGLPPLAERINQSARPIVIADGASYRAGNTVSLALELNPETRLYLLPDFDRLSPAHLAQMARQVTQPNPPASEIYALNLSDKARQQITAQLKWSMERIPGDPAAWLDRLNPG